jgi:hypothetical protein
MNKSSSPFTAAAKTMARGVASRLGLRTCDCGNCHVTREHNRTVREVTKALLAMHKLARNQLVEAARGLKSEHGENPEYDRALVGLVALTLGQPAEGFDATAKLLGIRRRLQIEDSK